MGTVLPITTPPLCDIHKLFIKPLCGLFLFFRGRTFESAHTVSWGPTLSRPRPGGPRGYPRGSNTNDSHLRLRMRHVRVLCLPVLLDQHTMTLRRQLTSTAAMHDSGTPSHVPRGTGTGVRDGPIHASLSSILYTGHGPHGYVNQMLRNC